MNESDLQAKVKKRFKVKTDSKANLPVADNLLDRQFAITQSNRVYVRTVEGWLYLATVFYYYVSI
ncbi:MAG: hypothetical protein HEEMFOPI_01407 [Holosporales bacterium]